MKQARKEELLGCFPPTPRDIISTMKEGDIFGRSRAANFCVFLTYGKELFIRCYHKYSRSNEIREAQRYVFAKDGFVRYGVDTKGTWKAMSFREPVFYNAPFYSDNGYTILNSDAIYNSDMRYSRLFEWSQKSSALAISYLKLYCKHPNIEYLVESGYGGLIYITCTSTGWITHEKLSVMGGLNFKSNNLLKILRLTKLEFKLLQGNEKLYFRYTLFREHLPCLKPEEVFEVATAKGFYANDLAFFSKLTGVSVMRIFRYLRDNKISCGDYRDYAAQCSTLNYDMRDTSIGMPHDFNAAHERFSSIIRFNECEAKRKAFEENMAYRVEFEYETTTLLLRQPHSMSEIIAEGKALHHCVGGYADRHAERKTNIFFIRSKTDPDTPYYTIEVSNNYTIIQCRGFRNDAGHAKPDEIKAFEQEYQKYLEELKHEHERVRVKSA